MHWRTLFLLPCLLLTACDGRSSSTYLKKAPYMPPLTQIKANLAFTCAHEQIPPAPEDADVLFQYARWLQKNNLLKQDQTVDGEIERLYRIAAEIGHYKANINLQNGGMRGRFQVRGAEQLRLSQALIDAGVATGYYFVGILLQQGAAGLKDDPYMALRYFRKAADEGSALAQYEVAEKLAPIRIAPDVARQMRRCAAEQGHGDAARALGVDFLIDGHYQESLEAFQLGVAGGDSTSAFKLSHVFRNPLPSDRLRYLGQPEDLERAQRYEQISDVLGGYSYANPSVPEINDILPLPPAELPEWDGKLQWLEARLANVPPPKPSEALIRKLAEAKRLEPETGRSTPASPNFIRADYSSAPTCHSGQPCPQTGYWKASDYTGAPRRFEQGQIMPLLNVRHHHRRFLLPDRITVGEEKVEWRLYG